MTPRLLDLARERSEDLVALRRDLHRHPELGFQEVRTAGVAAERMRTLGLEVKTEVGITGVVAELRNGEGPLVALRADMDALPIQEAPEHEYHSVNDGVMHACGHDAHTTCLVGAAHLLDGLRRGGELPTGTVRLLFQPSEEGMDEEGKSGAMRMIEEGAMRDVSAVVGLHVGGHAPLGKIFVGEGSVMAGSEELRVIVEGKSAHAARPHEGVDAVVLVAQGILATQQAVARRIDPLESGVITFGSIHGGTATNVLADRVTLRGTLRYFRDDVRERLCETLRASFGMLEQHGATVTVEVGPGYVPMVNDRAVTSVVTRALTELVGAEAIFPQPGIMGSEDFAFLAREAPGCFFWLGAALPEPREHHSNRFDIDESVLPLGAAALAAAAVELLASRG